MSALFCTLVDLRSLLILLIGFTFAANVHSHADKSVADNSDRKVNHGMVRYVVDGDSLYLTGLETQIRLWGIDAPERNEAGFTAARNALKTLVLGSHISCITMDIDDYHRIVARCVLTEADSATLSMQEDGSFDIEPSLVEINNVMLMGGSVREYCYFSHGYYGFCQ